jgi:hypothetical protein
VDLYAGTLRLAVWLAVRWKDPRLAWDPRQYANITKLWFLQEVGGRGLRCRDESKCCRLVSLGITAVPECVDGA